MFSADQSNLLQFSQGASPMLSEFKQKRDEYNIEIRKEKRDESLRKIRISNLDMERKVKVVGFSTLSGSFDTPENAELRKAISEWLNRQYKDSEFLELVQSVNSNDRFKQHYGIIGLRKLLAQENAPPIQHVIDMNLVPRFIEFASQTESPHLQFEAAWCLTNLVSGNTQQTRVIITKGGIECFLNLLNSSKLETIEQGIWALGNIAGDCHQFREAILKAKGLDIVANMLRNTTKPSLIKYGIWTLSNICRGRPLPDFDLVKSAIPIFVEALQTTTDPEILTDAAWALYYLSEGENNQIQYILESCIVPALVKYLESSSLSIRIPIIKILGNLLSAGNEAEMDEVLQTETLVPLLFKLLDDQKKIIRKDVCWVLSNITAGNEFHLGTVIGNSSFLNKLITLAVCDPSTDVRREAVWVLSNATVRCNYEQLMHMYNHRIVDCFCDLFNSEDPNVLTMVIKGLSSILQHGENIAKQRKCENSFYDEFEHKGIIKKIENLQKHKSEKVYEAAFRFMEKHYQTDDETL